MVMAEIDVSSLKAAILAQFPELAPARFTWATTGWDSVAADVDDRLIFKFPRHAVAERALRREASLLAIVRPAVTLTVPALTLVPGPPLFSRHAKIPGDHLVTTQYVQLPDGARDRLAADLGRFYAELHVLDVATMTAAGATPVEAWLEPEEILRRVHPLLSTPLRAYASRTIERWQALGADPYGIVYGFFDGHGWNMAFDHSQQLLRGIYDFSDSGFGPLHREFVPPSFISPDLTARIVTAYEAAAGRVLDRERIDVLTGVHRLWELAETDPASPLEATRPAPLLRNLESWVNRR